MGGWPVNPSAHKLVVVRGAETLTLPDAWIKVKGLPNLQWGGPWRVQRTVMPGVAGRVSGQPFRDLAEHDLDVWIRGDVLYDGSAPSTAKAGMKANVDRFLSFCAPPTSAPWTMAATFHFPDATTRTAGIQMEARNPDQMLDWGRGTVRITVLSGGFA